MERRNLPTDEGDPPVESREVSGTDCKYEEGLKLWPKRVGYKSPRQRVLFQSTDSLYNR